MTNGKLPARRTVLKTAAGAVLAGSQAGAAEQPTVGERFIEVGSRGMQPYLKLGEPFELPGRRLIFTNYQYIRPGSFGWYDDAGTNITVRGTAGLYDAHLRVSDAPLGIRIVAQSAERSPSPAPPLAAARPWEAGGVSLTQILFDEEDGYYKAWGTCSAEGSSYRCFLRSRNWSDWERPDLGVVPFHGSRKNNLVDLPSFRLHIFRDSSSREGAWKWFAGEADITRPEYEAFQRSHPHNWDPKADRVDVSQSTHVGPGNLIMGIKGGVSADGYRWTTIPELLSVEHADTINTCYYDRRLKKYVAYVRHWVMTDRSGRAPDDDRGLSWMAGRRSIGRAETGDFRRFPLSECILTPGPEIAGPSDTLYTNGHTFVPRAPGEHLFFPTIWHQMNDSTSVAVASSQDGKVLHWLPGNPVLTTGEFERWDGGCLFAHGDLLEWPDGTWALPYSASNVPHKYPRKGAIQGGAGFATWKRGRLIALEAAERGEFSTYLFLPPGRRMQMNATTLRGGGIRVEIADHRMKPVPGRSFADSKPVIGDRYRAPIAWTGGEDIGAPDGRPVLLRFKLDQAKLFFLDFV